MDTGVISPSVVLPAHIFNCYGFKQSTHLQLNNYQHTFKSSVRGETRPLVVFVLLYFSQTQLTDNEDSSVPDWPALAYSELSGKRVLMTHLQPGNMLLHGRDIGV